MRPVGVLDDAGQPGSAAGTIASQASSLPQPAAFARRLNGPAARPPLQDRKASGAEGHVVCHHDGSGEVEVMAGVSASGEVERETLHFQRSAAEFNEHGRMCALRVYKVGKRAAEPHDPDRNTA